VGDFRISVELGSLIPFWSPLNAAAFPNLAGAVKMITEAAHQHWIAFANGAPLPSGKVISNRTGEYARSIQIRPIGPFAAEVFSDLRYARQIEEGSPARDMKKILNTSLKVRLSAKGTRYLIIPFRHSAPGSVVGQTMPPAVATWWKDKTASRITGRFRRISGTGAWSIKTRSPITVAAWKYRWGSRLGKADLEGMGITGKAADRLKGMVMFRKPGVKAGGSAHTQYITFRVMSESSKGWIAPATEGKWPAKTVADTLRPIAEEAFRAAVTEDVKALLGRS